MDRIELVHCDTLSCEAIVRRAPNGELILVCQCGGTGEPMPENRVYVFHSADEGSTWTKPQLIVPDNGRAVYATEVAVAEGEIIVFLTEHDGRFTDWHSYAVSSFDGGYTFTKKCDMAQLSGFCFARGGNSFRQRRGGGVCRAERFIRRLRVLGESCGGGNSSCNRTGTKGGGEGGETRGNYYGK